MVKKSISLLSFLFLISCAQNSLNEDFTQPQRLYIIEKPVYPFLEKIPLPDDPQLREFEADMPRDLSKKVVKNTTECKKASQKERETRRFKEKCEEHPVILDSNIYLGFDEKNWLNLQYNFIVLKEKIEEFKKIIGIYNEKIDKMKENQEKDMKEFENKLSKIRESQKNQ